MAIPKMQPFLISAMFRLFVSTESTSKEKKKINTENFYVLTAGGNRIECFPCTIKSLFESLMIFTFSVPYRGM